MICSKKKKSVVWLDPTCNDPFRMRAVETNSMSVVMVQHRYNMQLGFM